MNHVVYHAYGNSANLHEAALSMLSFFRHNAPQLAEVHVYTDDALFFKNIFRQAVSCHDLPQATVKKWRGEIDFVHRVKVEMLRDFVSTQQGNVLYLDTDTFVLSNLTEIFTRLESGNLYMHTDEGALSDKANPMMRKTHKFVSRQAIPVNGVSVKLPPDMHMWNAGVLGFNTKKSELLNDVLNLTDAMHPLFPKHVVEQLAFSFYINRNGIVQPAEQWIYHYWDFKEFRVVLQQYFEAHPTATFEEHFANLDKLDPREHVKPKQAFERRPRWWKMLMKLRGKSWEFGEKWFL